MAYDLPFSEEQLLAWDLAYSQAKDSGALMADADRRALNEQNQVDALQGGRMLNSSYTGSAPRTLEGAFGPHIRSTHAQIVPMDEPMHPVDLIVIKVSAFCCSALVVIFTGEYLGWWPL